MFTRRTTIRQPLVVTKLGTLQEKEKGLGLRARGPA
jgi:hypothetical protein